MRLKMDGQEASYYYIRPHTFSDELRCLCVAVLRSQTLNHRAREVHGLSPPRGLCFSHDGDDGDDEDEA